MFDDNERSNVVKTLHDVEHMPMSIGGPKKYNKFSYYMTHNF